ncbi:hypothetical protein Mgra_00003901 [Meloidogyne graminicola]|uniref:Uncharacterized protein n=1 Tax=Meloidogyne graminicola TaxID=189291 RepID=A0A8S9ZTZ0_9BILA|nr:hypothetical protein Mgra_00003901 [Meloidogyne graminicola]
MDLINGITYEKTFLSKIIKLKMAKELVGEMSKIMEIIKTGNLNKLKKEITIVINSGNLFIKKCEQEKNNPEKFTNLINQWKTGISLNRNTRRKRSYRKYGDYRDDYWKKIQEDKDKENEGFQSKC